MRAEQKQNSSWRNPGPSWRELQGCEPLAGDAMEGGAPPRDWIELVQRRRHLRWAVLLALGVVPFFLVVCLLGLGVVWLSGRDPQIAATVDNGVAGLLAIYMLLAQGSLMIAWQRLRGWRCPVCDWMFFKVEPVGRWPTGTTCAHCGAELPSWYTRR